ncbi:MAG: DUF58 domain-containing protein [Candidatus Sumerlaeaceae bacterium]|nr:DUF58 domain-containing protein [Candidatus Sumerlaeaceae bacterium]
MTIAAENIGAGLLTPDFLAKLKQLELVSRKLFAGRMKGERRTRNRGTSVEFADFRNYVYGDEPRFVDWNTYGRLEKLFLKLFVEEEDLFVYFLVDTSKSMDFGTPNKLQYARQVAAALAYVSLLSMDRVSIAGFGTGLSQKLPPKRGRSQAMQVFDFLAALKSDGPTSLENAARRFALEARRSGLVIFISDFLDKAGYETALKQLLHKRCEVYAIHVLSPEEMNPPLAGDLRLVDAEDGQVVEITVTERLLRNYRSVMSAYCEQLRAFCIQRGIGYIPAPTNAPFEDLILHYLKMSGLVR